MEVAGSFSGSRINILELACVLQVVKKIARLGGGRAPLLVDSNVALRSSSKGGPAREH